MSKSAEVTLELMHMHLNAPLQEIQLFAGIEGPEEAQRAYPILREWTKSWLSVKTGTLARRTNTCVPQKPCPKLYLCNFNAVATYHAGLVLWAYGVLKRAAPSGDSAS